MALAVLALAGACGHVARPPVPPPGMTTVTYQGVSVFAPANWERNSLRCGTPVEDTVVVNPGPAQLCAIVQPPRVSYVELRQSRDISVDPEAAVGRQPVGVSGRTARRGEDRLPDGRTRVVLVVPDRNVVVVSVSLDPGMARGIADSASIS